ncbi:hypothetical protein GCM10027299_13300 [Larkinella ripae]
MNTVFCWPLICLAFVVVSFIQPPETLVGRWQQKTAGGNTVVTVFRSDGTNDIFINGKTFVSGKYYIRQDTLRYADPLCNMAYYGTYKLDFFAPDSLRLTVLEDTCRGRRRGFDRVTLGRMKPAKP